MTVDSEDPAHLSDGELRERIHDLTVEIASIKEQIESDSVSFKRSWRLARSTILMAGGLAGAGVELWTLVLAALGLWDWIDAVVEDAAAANRRSSLKQRLAQFESRLATLRLEMVRRIEKLDRP